MPLSLSNADFSHPWLRLGGPVLLFGCLLLLGSWALGVGHVTSLERESERSAKQAVALVETMLSHAQKANQQLFPFVSKPCEQALFALRKQVALVPFVRTISLVDEQGIYCNSLFGDINWPESATDRSDNLLRLSAGNKLREDHPLLAVRNQYGKGAVSSTIDGEYLQFMLALSGKSTKLLLHVGPQWLDEQGKLHQEALEKPTFVSHESNSTQYPFSIYAGYDESDFWHSLWQGRWLALSVLLGASMGCALLLWWLLGRPRSPASELARALHAKEFVPYLQPLVSSDNEQLIGVEVLMRWQHPSYGLIRPDLFIPQAEESGAIIPMTSLLMDTVAQQLGAIQDQLPNGFHIGFNISAAHCRDNSLLTECRHFLSHFAPGKVVMVLELTERELLVANAHTLALFEELDVLGIQLAIDDFGTGHSSLAYLQQFRVDYLKIDKSFIGRIGTESLSEHIVDNVIDLATRLGLSLVAEGVETQQQAEYLKHKGVTYLQGYLFGRPMPLPAFVAQAQGLVDEQEVVGVAGLAPRLGATNNQVNLA